jgi:cytochrome b subunit of formate dehydrogenase
MGLSFLLAALSGVYFLFFPGGHAATDPLIVFTRTTWDLIHTWSGVVLIAAAILHFAIHWNWIAKVTRNLLVPAHGTLSGSPVPSTINS